MTPIWTRVSTVFGNLVLKLSNIHYLWLAHLLINIVQFWGNVLARGSFSAQRADDISRVLSHNFPLSIHVSSAVSCSKHINPCLWRVSLISLSERQRTLGRASPTRLEVFWPHASLNCLRGNYSLTLILQRWRAPPDRPVLPEFESRRFNHFFTSGAYFVHTWFACNQTRGLFGQQRKEWSQPNPFLEVGVGACWLLGEESQFMSVSQYWTV